MLQVHLEVKGKDLNPRRPDYKFNALTDQNLIGNFDIALPKTCRNGIRFSDWKGNIYYSPGWGKADTAPGKGGGGGISTCKSPE